MAASSGALVLAFPGRCLETASSPPPFFPDVPLSTSTENALRISNCIKFTRKLNGTAFRAMAQPTVSQPSAIYAREMERLSAKESLLLAFKDAGGFEDFVTGKLTEMQRIDVIERITDLESLNPTPRPTTSPLFEGRWNVEWFGPDTPGLFAIQFLSGRLPTALANVSKLDVWIKDGYGKLIGNLRFLNSLETKFAVSVKFTVEGPVRMKEEYVEGSIESPTAIEETVPEQLRSALGQASSAVQQLPLPVRDVMSSGITIPLSGTFQRLFMISYLDDEIFILRGSTGLPTVLTRLDRASSPAAEIVTEYDS